jgi:glycosyltransferase involved in cell wall biosynthesis
MKMLYASSISFPSQYANRLQVLYTSEALSRHLGREAFILGVDHVKQNEIYGGRIENFNVRRSAILAWRVLQLAKKNAVDVIYGREHPLLFLIIIYNRIFFRLPITILFEEHVMRTGVRFRFTLRNAAHVYCLTRNLEHDLKILYPQLSTSVLPDGVRIEDFTRPDFDASRIRAKFSIPGGAHVIAYVGSVGLHTWKGTDVLLDAMQYIDDPDITLVLGGVNEDQVVALRAAYPDPRIRLLSWLTRSEAADLMRSADILVLPNKTGDANSERYTSPLKLFEYMASGTPLVASDLPSLREVLREDNACLVRPGDPQVLAESIRSVLGDPVQAAQRAAQARCEAQEYSWENRAERILSVTQTLHLTIS